MMAAIEAGMPVSRPASSLVVDIDGGTIVGAIRVALQRTPPELSADINAT